MPHISIKLLPKEEIFSPPKIRLELDNSDSVECYPTMSQIRLAIDHLLSNSDQGEINVTLIDQQSVSGCKEVIISSIVSSYIENYIMEI